jgi:hypothetical protein
MQQTAHGQCGVLTKALKYKKAKSIKFVFVLAKACITY